MQTAARRPGSAPRLTALLFASLVLLACSTLRAEPLSEEALIPGGTVALSAALGLDPAPDRARFMTEVTRVIYETPQGAGTASDILIRKLTDYLHSVPPGRPADTVPITLSLKAWRDVLQRPVALDDLFFTIIRDRRAALLCYGLAALDDETLQFLTARPALTSWLYEHDAGLFAAFAGSLRVRHDAIVVPGGDQAAPLWESVVGERTSRPDAFIRALFAREGGWVAYLYDTLLQLDAPTRAFGLGLWIRDERQRTERFKSLAKALTAYPGWAVPDHPFRRPTDDPMLIFQRVVVDAGGALRGPSSRAFWSEVFSSADLPAAGGRIRNVQDEGLIDAAWLTEALVNSEGGRRGERLDQIAFGLRAFAGVDDTQLPDVLVAVRAFPRYRMLMLTLERMGVTQPSTYAAAARKAVRLSALDVGLGSVALTQFQGALGMLARLVGTHVLDATQADKLVASLSAVPLSERGSYRGGVARWLRHALVSEIGTTSGDFDADLIGWLAGMPLESAATQTIVAWEDRTYRLDVAGTEARRLSRALVRIGAAPIGRSLALEAIADTLAAPNLRLDDLSSATTALGQWLAVKTWTPAGTCAAVAGTALQDLSTIRKPGDVGKAAHVAESLYECVDDSLAAGMLALAYALNLGDGSGTSAVNGATIRRHDFGFADKDGETRVRTPWVEPSAQVRAGAPWHVRGSLLGLELGLSGFAVRRLTSDVLPAAPVLAPSERDVFTKSVALMNPWLLRDDDRDEIAAAIERGRRRVTALGHGDGDWPGLADEIALDGWRRRAVRWTLEQEPDRVLSLFSLGELLYLGRPPATARLQAWGVAGGAHDGCFCAVVTPPGQWRLAVGRLSTGLLAAHVPDLNLRVALALAELKLPAALARGILATAMQDYVDRVKPLHTDDWLTMVRSAQALSKARIDEYVSALTANGPLVP